VKVCVNGRLQEQGGLPDNQGKSNGSESDPSQAFTKGFQGGKTVRGGGFIFEAPGGIKPRTKGGMGVYR